MMDDGRDVESKEEMKMDEAWHLKIYIVVMGAFKHLAKVPKRWDWHHLPDRLAYKFINRVKLIFCHPAF